MLNTVEKRTKESGGVTFDLRKKVSLEKLDFWYFPKYPSKTKILPLSVNLHEELEKFVDENKMFLLEPDCFLGTWINPKNKKYYLDITTCVGDLGKAREFCAEISKREKRKIVSIYNPYKNKVVFMV